MNRPFGVPRSASVVIPTCNEGDLVTMTVDSVLAAVGEVPVEIVVVDDGSTDGCCDRFRIAPDTRVRLVETGGLGVAGARNAGAEEASGEMLVFLDAHCTVEPGWIDQLARAMRRPDVALVSPTFTQLGAEHSLRGAGMGWAGTMLESFWYEPVESADRAYEVPLTCGACQAFPTATFHALGRFDDGCTRWGFEDHEIALRAWLLGYRVVVHPEVTVAHLFRTERSNYEVDDTQVLFNFLRMTHLHLSDERLRRMDAELQHHAGFAEAQRMLDASDTRLLREELLAVRQRDDDWFFATFFPTGSDSLSQPA